MARSPFSGTFQPNLRPTIVTAPDTIVMINGETDLLGCQSCQRRFDWNRYITSVQVDLSIDSVPGSASVSLAVPRHSISDFYFEGTPLISPMMEIEIYSKGYYLVGGVPQYYPVFWGMITEVGDNYSSGEHTVTIHANDILKWWEICKMNINPAMAAGAPGQTGQNLAGNTFYGTNPYDVIWTLAQQATGDVIQGAQTLSMGSPNLGGQGDFFSTALGDVTKYWNKRFQHMRSNLLLYGFNGIAIRGDSLYESINRNPTAWGANSIARAVSNAQGAQGNTGLFDTTDPSVQAIKTVLGVNVQMWQSEMQTKLELANAAKEAIGYEFYMDVDGSIVFKPPFYNLDVIDNKPVSWIQDIDIIDWDFSESESEVVTHLQMSGSFAGNIDIGVAAEANAVSNIVDYHLLRRYGWRTHTYNSEFMNNNDNMLTLHGLDVLDRLNSKRHRATITIPMRSEMRLGFPVYVAPKDQIWYVNGISHNIAFGGRATTTLTLTAKRTKFIAPQGVGKLNMTSPPSTPSPNKAPAPVVAGQTQAQPSTPNPAGTFTYTPVQVQSGKFTLVVGGSTFPNLTPPPDGTQAVNPSDPNRPLILRHPKTGRVVGYPNAVMVYVQPYQVPGAVFDYNQGKMTTAQAQARLGSDSNSYTGDNSQREADLTNTFQAGPKDQVTAKYLNNTYQFGLGSAGVFTYAQDAGGGDGKAVISEICILPAANITAKLANGSDAPFVNASSIIRPISDSRGFEVIGHYRYGRGVALSSGALVYNNNGGSPIAASVNLQVALSGDLFATLAAQSAGLTSVTSSSLNPISALTSMAPDDIQGAGTVTTPTASNTVAPGGTANALQSVPLVGKPLTLGSQGYSTGLNVSNLSRAVTLSAMTVVDTQGALSSGSTANCMCLLGRADLTFINSGYQIQVLPTSASDNSTLSDPNNFTIVGGVGLNEALALQPNAVNPSSSSISPAVIDTFLYSLYSALDGPHQAYEAQIIGDQTSSTAPQATFPPGPTGGGTNIQSLASIVQQVQNATGQVSSLSGTIAAKFAQATDTTSSELTQTWTAFATSLQNQSLITLLTVEGASTQAQLKTLNTQLEQLQNSQGLTIQSGDKASQIAMIQTQISAATQKLSDTQLQLAQITPPPQPTTG